MWVSHAPEAGRKVEKLAMHTSKGIAMQIKWSIETYLEVGNHIVSTLQQKVSLLSSVMHASLIGMIRVSSAGCRRLPEPGR